MFLGFVWLLGNEIGTKENKGKHSILYCFGREKNE